MKSFLTIRLEEEPTEAVEIPAAPPSPKLKPTATTTPRPPRKPRQKPTKPEVLPPPEEVRRVLLENKGVKYDALREALPVSRYALKKLYAEMQMPAPRTNSNRPRIHVPKERLEEMIAKKMSRYEMEKVLGISNRGVINLLARYGLRPFDPYEENRNLGQQGLRRCSVCQQVKSLETDFYLSKKGILKKAHRCKPCANRVAVDSARKTRARKAAATPNSAAEATHTTEPKSDNPATP